MKKKIHQTVNSGYLQDMALENNFILNSGDSHTFLSPNKQCIYNKCMLFFFFFKQKAPLVSSLASQLSALENKQPSTVHRLEKLEPASLQVLHERDTALSAASSQLAITPPSSSAYAGGVGRAQQDGWSGRQVGGRTLASKAASASLS